MTPEEILHAIKEARDIMQNYAPASWYENIAELDAAIAALEAEPMSGPFPLTEEGIKQALEATDRCPTCEQSVRPLAVGWAGPARWRSRWDSKLGRLVQDRHIPVHLDRCPKEGKPVTVTPRKAESHDA